MSVTHSLTAMAAKRRLSQKQGDVLEPKAAGLQSKSAASSDAAEPKEKKKKRKKKKQLTPLQVAIKDGKIPKARKPYALFTAHVLTDAPKADKVPGKRCATFVKSKWDELSQSAKHEWKLLAEREAREQRRAMRTIGLSGLAVTAAASADADPGATGGRAPAIPELSERQEQFGPYRLLQTPALSQGSYGKIVKAKSPNGITVVIKVGIAPQNDDAKQEVMAYVRIVEQFKYNGAFLAPLAVSENGPFPYIVLPYVAGGDVGRFLLNSGAFKDENLRAVILQLCGAVRYLHKIGLLHLDIKPANMLWDPAATHLYLVDLGMSAFLQNGRARGPLHLPVATCSYRPPELWDMKVGGSITTN